MTTQDIFHWLYYTVFKNNPNASFVGFALKYDFSQWLRDLPQSRAAGLFTREGIAKRRRTAAPHLSPFPEYWRDASAYPEWTGGEDIERPECEWEIDFLGDKRMKLRPYTGPHRSHQQGVALGDNPNPWLYINDTFSFFQCSFIKAIDPAIRLRVALERESINMWNGTTSVPELPVYLTTTEDYDLIVAGKKRRANAPFDDDMIKYNDAEIRVLAALMREVNQGLSANRIYLKRSQFFGPGQVAQTSMDHPAKIPVLVSMSNLQEYHRLVSRLPSCIVEIAELEAAKVYQETPQPPYIHFSAKNIRERVPNWFREAARKSFYGGRFELFFHGIFDGVAYEYDINSAYPRVMTQLPCLMHGQYVEGRGSPYRATRALPQERGFGTDPGQTLCLVFADIKGSHPRIGALPFRHKHDGRILFPHRTIGWHWLHEIEAAKRAGCIDTVAYKQWWAYIPCDCPPPLAYIGKLYEDRTALGKEGKNSPNGVAKKLNYNSAYGKTAQSVGDPKYGNPIYASLITAGCRCMILDAIATHPEGADAVLNIATDGIWFASQHPTLELHKTKLGAWDVTLRDNPMLFKPGTYWDDVVREKVRVFLDQTLPETERDAALAGIKMKSRGVNMTALAKQIDLADRLFSQMQPETEWPSFDIDVPLMIMSPSLALQRNKWHEAGRVRNDRKITITSNPANKRVASGPGYSRAWACNPMFKDNPYETTLITTPYRETFGDPDAPRGEYLHPDGGIIDQLEGMLYGKRDVEWSI